MLEQNSTNNNEDLMSLIGVDRLKLYLQSVQPDMRQIDRLTGDASTRQYFRVHTPAKSLIAAVYQENFDPREHSYCTVTRLFADVKLPVPEIVAVDGKYGVILQEDLGDTRLQDCLETASNDDCIKAYRESIDLILAIQAATDYAIETGAGAAKLAFDETKLMWELDFFFRHYFKSYLQTQLSEAHEQSLMAELREIAVELAGRPRVLCHRDYHSRNLMLWQGKQYIIDHQDARMGPQTYDLASLLRDPYVSLSEETIAQLYQYFIDQKQASGASADWAAEIAAEFELMTVQRILKAIGTYAYQTAVVKNTVYVGYIPRAVATALAAAARLQRFPILQALLSEQAQTASAL